MRAVENILKSSFIFAALGILACDSGRTIIVCGGAAAFVCPSGMYCELGESCGGIDREGSCRPMPRDCPLENDPVCSCEGKTFQSACYSNASGQSVAYRGQCMKGK